MLCFAGSWSLKLLKLMLALSIDLLQVADTILKYMKWAEQENEYAILVNNLGTTSALEMGVLLKSAVDYFEARQLKITRVYCGTFMTSTDMSGFSISLLKLKEELMAYLDAPVKVYYVVGFRIIGCLALLVLL